MDQEKEFNKIHTWIVHKGYHLIVDSKIDNGIDHKSKIISLNSRYNKTDKIYILLHECGHLLALSNKKSKFFLLKDSFEEGSASF